MRRKFPIVSLLCFFLISSLYAQRSQGTLSIAFEHYVEQVKLQLDTMAYKNASGQSFLISKFNYYISNITLLKNDGKEIRLPGYFLIKEEDENSKKIALSKVPSGEYSSIRFMIGVDSVKNCSGAQSGALDPINAMFWTWNTGYIFMKLEGKSPASSAPGKIFEYHIGGYKQPSNCIRMVTLKFDAPLKKEKASAAEIKIRVNAGEILKTPTNIDFSHLPVVTDHNNAQTIADNYSDMFSLEIK